MSKGQLESVIRRTDNIMEKTGYKDKQRSTNHCMENCMYPTKSIALVLTPENRHQLHTKSLP